MFHNKRVLLSCCILFTFAAFIFVCIATAGSSSNYKPITNVFIGDAGIKHINVTKVIPPLEPVVDVLSRALLAPGADQQAIFGALKNISKTSVLAPFLTILVNSQNTTTTLNAITNLAPLAFTSGVGSTKEELAGINSLLASSKDANSTVDNLQDLLDQVLNNNSSSMASLQKTTFVLLKDSKDPVATTESLVKLSSLSLADMAPLMPAFQILQGTKNITGSFVSLETLMNATIPTSLAQTMFSTIETQLAAGSNVDDIFDRLSAMVPQSLTGSMDAVRTLLVSANSANATLGYLSSILAANLTSSPSAKNVLATISNLYDDSNNQTLLLTSVTGLVSAVGNKDVVNELTSLDKLIEASNTQSDTVNTLSDLQDILATDTSNNKYIPYLFDMLQTSKDPAATFSSLLNVTQFAAENMAMFTPVLGLLGSAIQSPEVTDEQIYDVIPQILDFLNIPAKFRLSIFTLCHVSDTGKVLDCSKSHAVQNLDFRNIIYDALMKSDFNPYLTALDISADDLELKGKLLNKEHMYVPAVKAVLAMNLLFIISTFAITMFFIYMFVKVGSFSLTHRGWFILMALSLFCPLFSGLGATIVAAMITMIKSGTKHDRYNVVYTRGVTYSGLTWSAFTLTFITSMIVGLMWLNHWKAEHNPFAHQEPNAESTEGSGDSDTSSKISKNNVTNVAEKV
ncbi:Ina1p KNAG_0B06310 [Huiozyma naganishii CBS 8797]|uniref:Uncharacterized protein n=1 Tax=Huiozyma naganishii (strain ATCC MYA-139 / BCRC 22969 / CBS 8797 / KCTC 17520 / NBRC 10181 / NCYC 3082 / Yp74L-3) TaxID=1071383 RepID=J7R2M0_HUIN7|nr:hypothetical protein KNAG_0B06310 [Kazachstania naganishii CBS 8797]CCK69060.1 hypothetical protein KNAG_0B06310 [Kazachstania naganishii CBS 8797]